MADETAIITNIGNVIAAIAALGTASMGLVDALKVFGSLGPSRVGFGDIQSALLPLLPPDPGVGAFNRTQLLQTLRANWMNGVAKSDQKAKAKSLIHLGLIKGGTGPLAVAAGVDPDVLADLAESIGNGTAATQEQLNVLGQFDAILSAVLDAAYERADQRYRNFCKALATAIAVALSLIAAYFMQANLIVALVAGIAAVPLAPVSKDLVTTLQAAAASIQKTNRVKV